MLACAGQRRHRNLSTCLRAGQDLHLKDMNKFAK